MKNPLHRHPLHETMGAQRSSFIQGLSHLAAGMSAYKDPYSCQLLDRFFRHWTFIIIFISVFFVLFMIYLLSLIELW